MSDSLTLIGTVIGTTLGILYISLPLWLPPLLIFVFWQLWVDYIRREAIAKREYILLEIKLPKEIRKSPKAMEIFLNALSQTGGEGNWFAKYWKGGTRAWFSLEMISLEGQIKFLVWMEKSWKNLIESQIYAQYPGAEIYEVADYARDVNFDPEVNSLWGSDIILTKADPYPIKTYIDYELKASDKEEEKVDPISATLEFLGSLSLGEQAWIQIMVRAHKEEDGARDNLKEQGKKEIEKILKEAKLKEAGEKVSAALVLSKGQQEAIAAIEKSLSKPAYDVGIRIIYFAEKDKFQAFNIPAFLNSFKQYNSVNLNGFKPANTTSFDYPWQDWRGKKIIKKKKDILDAFKRRSYFHPPYKSKHFVLNSDELATIYHFPGEVVKTPTLARISSKKAEPPTNLPL